VHQTFYIDIDEEITYIVDRLRTAKTREVVIVVPKRAILIQSIVNLKLLKKEADSLKKELIIVTQDKFGKMLIEKAGISVEQKLDDIDGQDVGDLEIDASDDVEIKTALSMGEPKDAMARQRLDKIGSDEYYQPEELAALLGQKDRIMQQTDLSRQAPEREERIINKELVIDMGDDLKKNQASFKKKVEKRGIYAPMDMIRNMEISEDVPSEDEKEINSIVHKKSKNLFKQEAIPEFPKSREKKNSKTKKVNDFFGHQKASDADEYKNINVGSHTGKYFMIFSAIAIVALFGVAVYLFLPKASITVFAKNKIAVLDSQMDGNVGASEVDVEKEVIPAKVISVSSELTSSYDATGTKGVSNQKAHGTLTIYNEFSASPQPLVATTRFESPDKKIFRLVKGIIIPGMNGDKPGAIEAEVMADESGETYNIEAASFTIPGFQSSGGDKYAKIYAKSFKAMIGGGQGTQTMKTITESDISSAKTKVAQELRVSINQKLKESAGDGYILLDDAISIDDSSYTTSNSAGDALDKFSVTVKIKASAIVFRGDDVKKVVANSISKKSGGSSSGIEGYINLEFGKSDINFNDGSIIIRVHSSETIIPNIDLENLKNGLLGKKENELKLYLSEYPDIDRVEVGYWPSFMTGKIPAYESRVDIILDPALTL